MALIRILSNLSYKARVEEVSLTWLWVNARVRASVAAGGLLYCRVTGRGNQLLITAVSLNANFIPKSNIPCILIVVVRIPPVFSVLLTYSLKINSLLFLTHPLCI